MKQTIALLLILCIFVACVPTPETTPILNQNGVFEEKANAVQSETQDLLLGSEQNTSFDQPYPHLSKSYMTERGITIEMDADILVPTVSKIPLLQMQACAIPNQRMNRFLDFFFGNQPLYDASKGIPESKEDISESIQRMGEQLAIYEEQGDTEKINAINSALQFKQQAYQTAPYRSELQLSQIDRGTLHSTFDVASPSTRSGWMRLNLRDEREDGLYNISFVDYGWNGCYTNHQAEKSLSKQLPFSEEEAIQQAKKILENLDITDMMLSSVSYGYAYDYDTHVRSDRPESVRLIWTRSVSGIPQPQVGGFAWYEQYASENSAEYNKPWQPEYIDIEVDQNGLVCFSWYNPMEITKIVNENIEVISLDHALEIFDYVIDMFYSFYITNIEDVWGDWAETLTVSKIEFAYQLRRQKDAPDAFELVPCWIFSQENGRRILVLNAVDGTIFNSGLNAGPQNGR